MTYQAELQFTERLLQNMNLCIQYLKGPQDYDEFAEKNLWNLFHQENIIIEFQKNFLSIFEENIIYRIRDAFFCNFLVFRLPDTTPATFASIGPYRLKELTEQDYLHILEHANLPLEQLATLKKFYEDIPFFADEQRLLHIIYTLGEFIWGNADNFSIKLVNQLILEDCEPIILHADTQNPIDTLDTMRHLEERYAIEAQIIQAVSQGQSHKAEIMLNKIANRDMEKHSPDPIRNMKNYCIILNTLLRKAAELGAVHPLHIDSLSSKFAIKIENAVSTAALTRLQSEMVHKYCLLVKNHSMQGYSLLIRKVLTRIDTDLTADLSLRAQAALLNINSSYLSTLFKKEVGMTLTDYVNNKRVEHALFLLNTTTMQIQAIAQHCGIPDVNYFTKTFKKHIGKTPKEYRDSVMPYKR